MTSARGTSDRDPLGAVVVGGGWAGMYMLHELRELGLRVHGFELGSNFGGTWYWNRYPGARCDIPNTAYQYTWNKEIWDGWNWSERYGTQPEIERYAAYVAERLNLRPYFSFNTKVTSVAYNEVTNLWSVDTDKGDHVLAKYCFMCTGGYTVPIVPAIDDLDAYEGELYYTARWPEDKEVTYNGKRVGVIGTGSSGMQVATKLGKDDEVSHLYVFQRTANFAQPGKNSPMDPGYLAEFKKTYESFRQSLRDSGAGNLIQGEVGPVANMSEEEFQKLMDENWARGFNPVAGITDYGVNEKANAMVAEYCRQRIRARVKDPRIAELLCAKDHFFSARRLLNEDGYFEIYNKPTVSLVDVKADSIRRFTPTGIELESGTHYELDMIILATGFDSGTGGMLHLEVTGRGGRTLKQSWADGPVNYLGLQTTGFPNMFMLAGPGSPSIRSNVMQSIEQHVEWLADLIKFMEKEAIDSIEPTAEAERQWTRHVADTVNATLMARDDTQYVGSNVPGKPRVYLAYVGGVPTYRLVCDRVRDKGYEGFVLKRDGMALPTSSESWSGPPNEPWLRTRWGSVFGSSVI